MVHEENDFTFTMNLIINLEMIDCLEWHGLLLGFLFHPGSPLFSCTLIRASMPQWGTSSTDTNKHSLRDESNMQKMKKSVKEKRASMITDSNQALVAKMSGCGLRRRSNMVEWG
jgi:hypothetical protein